MQFTILQTTPGYWTWHLRSESGHLLAKGMEYLRKEDCLDSVLMVRASGIAVIREVETEARVEAAA